MLYYFYMKRWEYTRKLKHELIGRGNEHTTFKREELDEALNKMGDQGWELVASERTSWSEFVNFYYFKREKK